MSMSRKKCCVPGCLESGGSHKTLHLFPNPVKDGERFRKWVFTIGGDILGLNNQDIYKHRSVCHAHFEEKFCCRNDRLSNDAIPTLNLPGSLSLPKFTFEERRPMRQIVNYFISPPAAAPSATTTVPTIMPPLLESQRVELMQENIEGRRQENGECLKCGRSPVQDPSTRLFRFPKPGAGNAKRCESWTKYCYPDQACSSKDFQERLHLENKVLCDKHFPKSAFINEQSLHPHSIPGTVEAENTRNNKCAKCGATSNEDSSLTFHRFPQPSSVQGSLKARVWAKFCYPNGDWDSDQSLIMLYKQHKLLCGKHFDESSFTNNSRKRLNNFAIPIEARNILAELRNDKLNKSSTETPPPRTQHQDKALQEYMGTSTPSQKFVGTSTSKYQVGSEPGPSFMKNITESDTQHHRVREEEMAIVEDEVWNESEEENEIEVVVEEYNGEQDSDDSDDDDDADDAALERKVAVLELRIKEDPYNYDDHIELIQALWALSELDRWRAAFDNLQQMTPLKPEHWLMRLQTESQLSHTPEAREAIAELFQQATLDCYYIQIFTEWCSWSLSGGDITHTRTQMQEVLKLAGADPLSGKLFWEAKLDFEKALLESMSEEDDKYKEQRERVLFCLEEIVSRPLLHGEELWSEFTEVASSIHGQEYVDKVKKQHEAALEYLQKISPFEDRILTLQNVEEKYIAYLEYIETVVELSKQDRYRECDSDGILKVLYERASSECATHSSHVELLSRYARFTRVRCSRASAARALRVGTRRAPRCHLFWTMQMQQAEHEEKDFTEIKNIFETALSKGMESYKQSEHLWLSYVEYVRRQTDFNDEQKVERLRDTFRLAWDSLAELWGEEANDSEIPLFWARVEYTLIKDHKRGKEIFEEIFRYGENKTMSKYWEALVRLEMNRSPPISENKLRELFRRALRSVTDYPPAIVAMWTDYERIYGRLDTLVECNDTCEEKLKEWREYYKAMKEKMTGNKKQKINKQIEKKPNKPKFEKRKQDDNPKKRKSDDSGQGSEVKKKRDGMEVDEKEKEGSSTGVKRSHETEDSDVKDKKRQRRDSSEGSRSPNRDACTLFVSNLEFKVNETNLRNKLSEYGEIVSLRLKSGVKAFGGSICYCQYKNRNSVDKAIEHDRTPLDGRPMFFSRYSASKGKPQFKYATTTEKNKLFVRNLPFASCTKDALTEIFGQHGKLKDIRVVTFKDGKPKGLAYIEYEDEASAAQALDKTNGLLVGDKKIEVAVSAPPPRPDSSQALLGQPKREPTGGMRRTQLSSFIPSVLANAKPSTSKAPDTHSNGEEKRPLSNKDFRSMLLKK